MFIYLPPEGSFVYDRLDMSAIDLIQREMLTQSANRDVDIMVAGDFNARCGHLDDYIDNDAFLNDLDWYNDIGDSFCVARKSEDSIVNNFGNQLIDLCTDTMTHILNGRKQGDEQGQFTCVTANGKSVVDYILVSTTLYDCINEFVVDVIDVTHRGIDHFPVYIQPRT